MSSVGSHDSISNDRHWFIVGRWQEYEGEGRANLLRVLAIGAFYIVQLVTYQIYNIGDETFHRSVTALAVAWTMVALGVHLCLRRQVFPAALKYWSTTADVVLLTGLLVIATGARSPMVVGYFLIIAVAALRFKLRLVWCATLGSMAGYLFVLGYDRWYLETADELRVPRHEQLITLLAIGLTGIVLGQIIRRVKHLADHYARRLDAAATSNETKETT
jgi:hypothetical protein